VKSSQKKNARSTTRRTGTGTKTSTSASAASSEVYNRLYSKGTVSYNSKRKMATSDTIITNVTKKTPLKSTTNNKRM
jgi:hypothetical protein